MLSQTQNGKEKVIAYASRKLTNTEARYAAHKLEFLALKWVVTEKLKDYLFGNEFTVFTDNNPLCYVMQTVKLDACRQRWVAELSSYNFNIVYRPGKSNTNADALSRMHQEEVKRALDSILQSESEEQEITSHSHIVKGHEVLPTMKRGEMQTHQKEDKFIAVILKHMENDRKPSRKERQNLAPEVKLLLKQWHKLKVQEGVLVREISEPKKGELQQIVLPTVLQEDALQSLHNMSHPGSERTLELMRERFYWPKMADAVKHFCETCQRCGLRKPLVTERAPLQSIHTSKPLELVCIDYLSLEKSKGGIENVLVVTDHFTRLAQAYPTKDQTAKTVVKTLWKRFMCVYGIPQRIHADQGRNFESDLMKELCKITGMKKSRTTPYHPQGNGLTERFNSTLMNMLGTLDPSEKLNWKDHLETMTHAYNATVHDSTGYTPYYLMFGRHPRLPVDLAFGVQTEEQDEEQDYCEYIQSLRERLLHSYETAHKTSEKAKEKQQQLYDRKVKGIEFQPGDRVLTVAKGIKGRHKLADRWKGPYIVQERMPRQPVYVIQSESNDHRWTVHRNLLRQCMFLPSHSEVDENKEENTESTDNDDLKIQNSSDEKQKEMLEDEEEATDAGQRKEEDDEEEATDTGQLKEEDEEEEVDVKKRPVRIRKKP